MKKHSFGSRLFLGLVLLVLYLPIVVVVIYSFNDNSARIPLAFTGWTTRWYGELLDGKGGYGPALAMSLRVALWSVLLSVAIGSLGAVGIRDNVARLVLAHTTFCIPYVFLSVKSRLVGMDQSLFDAARDLGASPRRVLWDITLPLCRPAILSGAFLALAMSLDDFVISFFVYGAGEGTLPLKIYSSVKVGVSPRVNALCSLMIAVVFLAVATQRYVQAVRKAREKRQAES